MALRASIGAGRGRLLQQALVESAVLTMAATVVGIACAALTVPFIIGMLTTNEQPVYLDAHLDWRVLAFVGVLGTLTTVLFGLAPAIRASAAVPGETIVKGSRAATSGAGMARSLVAVQVAFSLIILFVAGLLLRSFDRLLAVDLGFAPEGITLLSVESRDRLQPAQAREVNHQLLERVQSLPGVESVVLGRVVVSGATGAIVGIAGGLYFARFVQTFLFEVEPLSVSALGLPVLGLLGVALAASWSPARRALRVDPAEALRVE